MHNNKLPEVFSTPSSVTHQQNKLNKMYNSN